ncbi:MAG: ABC transporter permease subunit [Methylacidiphilales bacterium]|nr:ABC transporter permease subunit [Candidatus Methylacidiphilales bacterium]
MDRKNLFQKFRKNKYALGASIIVLLLLFFSLLSELLCNDKPIVVYYQGSLFFPVYIHYEPSTFLLNYKEIDYQSEQVKSLWQQNGNWVIYPPIKFSYNSVNNLNNNPFPSPPSSINFLGTDDRGRDVLARILYGVRLNILFALAVTIVSALIGVFLGAVQGYAGGKYDLIIQRCIEVWSALPELYILLLASTLFDSSLLILFIILSLFSWISFNDYARAEFLRIKQKEYVLAAKSLGLSHIKIIMRHILPNTLIPIITLFPFRLGATLLALTSLDFLGLGVGDSYPSLGELLNQARGHIDAWWLSATSFTVLLIFLVSFVFIGEGIRDVFKDDSQQSN